MSARGTEWWRPATLPFFVWVSLNLCARGSPEISFPWNLLGYPAAANLGVAQITTVTGIYGVSFLVAAFNSLLAWCELAPYGRPERRLRILGITAALGVVFLLVTPRLVPHVAANT